MANTFANPINHGPDPWMTYYAGNYYLTTSQQDCIRMWNAPTISGLADAPGVVVWQDDNPARNKQVWAAEFHQIGDRWYMYYTASDGEDNHHRLFVLESAGSDPLGPYHFKAQMTDFWAIDPGLLILPNGDLYFLWTGHQGNGSVGNVLFIARMSNPWTIQGEGVLISTPDYDWERCGFPVNEAPELLQRNGKIFLIYSASDTGTPDYCLGMLTARADADLLDAASWDKTPHPVFCRDDANGVFGTGHNGFFKSPDGTEDWIVYHAKTVSDYTYHGRITRAQPFHWNSDDTPNFGKPVALGQPLKKPSGDNT
ncbi:MAG: glycoside hydrolase family 43 protein [Anaerolineae bacterium]|nr:glycoside hydrolase family 43 protein [Anaerolineae bacterium]